MINKQDEELEYVFTSVQTMMLYADGKGWLDYLNIILTDMLAKREIREIMKTEVKNQVTLEGEAEDMTRFVDWLFRCTIDGERLVDNVVTRIVDSE
jgi:hypothetical protein